MASAWLCRPPQSGPSGPASPGSCHPLRLYRGALPVIIGDHQHGFVPRPALTAALSPAGPPPMTAMSYIIVLPFIAEQGRHQVGGIRVGHLEVHLVARPLAPDHPRRLQRHQMLGDGGLDCPGPPPCSGRCGIPPPAGPNDLQPQRMGQCLEQIAFRFVQFPLSSMPHAPFRVLILLYSNIQFCQYSLQKNFGTPGTSGKVPGLFRRASGYFPSFSSVSWRSASRRARSQGNSAAFSAP